MSRVVDEMPRDLADTTLVFFSLQWYLFVVAGFGWLSYVLYLCQARQSRYV